MNDIKKILSKLGLVINPLKLIKLLKQVDYLFKYHQNNYPHDRKATDLYLKIDSSMYTFQGKKFSKVEKLPEVCSLITLSEVSITKSLAILGKTEQTDINALLKALSKVKNTDTFQKVIDEISEDFSTNLSLNQFIKIVGKKFI
ncbi:hypothetical protein [Lactococcus garvieae]|jgi:hypothetical protein|uniref:hypothetical protein n=1 Tax=Lactococcus garvieae TaxID=1363 RepID=UPI0023EAC76F|nr:hypothetical protein [Lactococcus garvieae]